VNHHERKIPVRESALNNFALGSSHRSLPEMDSNGKWPSPFGEQSVSRSAQHMADHFYTP
jgi:hypothetical protein